MNGDNFGSFATVGKKTLSEHIVKNNFKCGASTTLADLRKKAGCCHVSLLYFLRKYCNLIQYFVGSGRFEVDRVQKFLFIKIFWLFPHDTLYAFSQIRSNDTTMIIDY